MGQRINIATPGRQFSVADALPSFRVLRLLLSALLVSTVALSPTTVRGIQENPSATTRDKIHSLSPGEIIVRRLGGGEVHVFRLPLSLNQFAHVIVQQQGVDVAVKVSGPDGRTIIEVDSPNGSFGPERVSVIAPVDGDYKIEVQADKTQAAGNYELRVEGPRQKSQSDEQRVEAEALFMAGQKLRFQGTTDSRAEALLKYQAALKIWRELADAQWQGYTLCNMGRIYRLIGGAKFRDSLDSFAEAEAALRSVQDVAGQAFVLNETGAAHRELGNPLDALIPYQRALELRQTNNDLKGQAQLLNNIGLVYNRTGSQQSAIRSFDQALNLAHAIGDAFMEANTINNIALANRELGELTDALQKFQEVLKYCREAGDRRLEASALNNVGLIYDSWADSQAALDTYASALEGFRGLQDVRGEATVLENIGMVYLGLDDAPRALQYFQDALVIRERVGEPKGLGIVLHHLGAAQSLLGERQESLDSLDRALDFSRAAKDKQFEAYSLVEIGMIYVALADPAKALTFYEQALEIQKEDARGRAITLDKIAQAYGLINQPAKAIEKYDEALRLWIIVGDRQGEALSFYGLARVARDQNRLDEARDRIRQAIEKVESLRSKMTSHQLRMTYFAARQQYYELDIDIHMRLHALAHSKAEMETALTISERARARSLLDLLTEARVRINVGSSPQLAVRRTQLEQEITSLDQKLLGLRGQKRSDDAAAVEERLTRLIREHDDLDARIRAADPSYVELSQPQPLEARQIQALLDDNTLLLEYALGEKRSYLWVVSRTEVVAYALPARAEIEQAADAFRESITAFEPRREDEKNLEYIAKIKYATAHFQQRALALTSMVLAPISTNISNKRLVIVADGALQYVPFAALPAPAANRYSRRPNASDFKPLLLKNEVVYQPSASALALLREQPHQSPPKAVAVVADPVFDLNDQRVRSTSKQPTAASILSTQTTELGRALRDAGDSGDSDFKLERLAYSAREADAIVGAAAPATWMKAVDFKASRATAMSPELKQYKIVHFATHGILNGKHPELSGIVLSLVDEQGRPENGFLNLGDIYNLDLPVDLVVLSACRTGIGKPVRGEGLIGLTRGFMHAGATRVIASLWKVDDEATSELMKSFYQNLLVKKMPAAAALRAAQLEMMTAREQWRAPYYWAGFVLQGEWK